MRLNVRNSYWKLLHEAGGTDIDDWSFRQEDAFGVIDSDRLTEKDMGLLKGIAQKAYDDRKESGALGLVRKINAWKRVQEDVEGTVINDLNALVDAVKAYFKDTPNKWAFTQEDDGEMIPYYVVGAVYEKPDPEKLKAAETTITVSSHFRGGKEDKVFRYHYDDLGKTLPELLSARLIYRETPELVKNYEEELTVYKSLCNNTGEQYLATGRGFWHQGYYDNTIIEMEVDGQPTQVVLDDFGDGDDDDDHKRNRRGRSMDATVVDADFWRVGQRKHRNDEEDDGAVAHLPVQPYMMTFDLKKHRHIVIHINNLEKYVYNEQMVEKLILPEADKDLIHILVQGVDEQMEDIVKGKTGGIIVIATGPPGTGKCHGRGTKILMQDGTTKQVENIVVGDVLMGDDSGMRTVLSLARGRDEMYRITPLRGGESFTVNQEHIMVFAESPTEADEQVGTVEMSLRQYFSASKTRRHHLKLMRVPVLYRASYADRPCLVDPYWLGLWLGDGNAGYTGITTADFEVADYVRDYAFELGLVVSEKEQPGNKSSVYSIVGICSGEHHDNRLLDLLEGLGLSVPRQEDNRRHGSEKFIPHCYLIAAHNTRSRVLAGIVDSDGYTSYGDGVYEVTFKSERLARDTAQLARSLGYTASVKPKKGTIKRLGFSGQYWRVCLSAVHDLPLRIKRRAAKAKREQIKRNLVTGFRVEPLGLGDYFGFTLSGNGRYLLADFTVTHNTLTAETFSECVHRPLYSVQCSQLGTTPDGLEKKLLLTLNRAARWKAILLIDEADVYIHARGSDIDQNAIVGVWLRILEYYKGIMFMTSNRDVIIDDAILSRATAWIRYTYPTRAALMNIWRVLGANYRVTLTLQTIEKLVAGKLKKISGRTVKNLLKLARLLSLRKNKPVTVELIEYVSQYLDIEVENENDTASSNDGGRKNAADRGPVEARKASRSPEQTGMVLHVGTGT